MSLRRHGARCAKPAESDFPRFGYFGRPIAPLPGEGLACGGLG